MSVDDLLPEIWHRILKKLPAKSILRCRSVCKTWYSLISSTHFIAAQTLNHSTCNRVLALRYEFNSFYFKFSSHDESFVESHEHDEITEQFRSGDVQIVGSCNGLVCLLKVLKHTDTGADKIEAHSFLIWNPSIRKLVQLPEIPTADVLKTSYLLGFGFDSVSGDYKVLRVVYLSSYSHRPRYGVSVLAEIFDLRKGVWRAISCPITTCHVNDGVGRDSCVYLNGSLHWIGYEDQSNFVIESFNLSSEVFQKMGIPGDAQLKDVQDSGLYSVLVSANEGLLSVALLRKQLQGDVDHVCCSVWSMKEYGVTESWIKLVNIELPYALNSFDLLRFRENGVVYVSVGGSDLVGYNPENRTSKALLSVDEDDGFFINACFYQESLVLL